MWNKWKIYYTILLKVEIWYKNDEQKYELE